MSIMFFTCSRVGDDSLENPETQITHFRMPSIPLLFIMLTFSRKPHCRREEQTIVIIRRSHLQRATTVDARIQPIARQNGNRNIPKTSLDAPFLTRLQIGTYDSIRPLIRRIGVLQRTKRLFECGERGNHIAAHLLHGEGQKEPFLSMDE